MITRKTRLTSALLAVLMVVTMLAAYVLPVTAEESSPYPYVRDMETLGRDYADDWGIGAAEDWIAAIELNRNGESFNGKTLHFTADIDFDVDGSGETDPEEYIDVLGNEDFSFKGNIHGHGYVIKNLFLDHDLATEGKYVGLIGYANKSGMVIRDLGIASGTINIHGTPPQKENYSGAFMAYGSAVVFANCWNAATINAKMTYVVDKTELDMAPFGRGSGYTIVNCFNRGDMISEGAVTNRTDAFLDWTTTATQVYNCVNVGDQKGNSNHFFTFGSGTDTEAEYQQFVGNIGNIYVHNLYSDINKSGIDALMNYKDYEIEMNEYYTGELASKLNDNYVDKFDSLYGRKYFTLDENGELAMTDDPYEALYKLTVSKMIGDYAVSTETSFVKATTPFDLPSYEGYVLESHTDAIMPDYETNTFRMPPQNAELNYAANVPDWGIIEDLIEQYEGMVASGHVKAFKDAAAITELLDKMQLSYANKDNMTKEQAMARIALYVKDNANLDLTLKDDLAYPNYPLARYFDKSISKIWGIKSLEDWQAMIKIAEEDKESFSGITFHFLNDVDFQNVNVEPLGISTGFAGTIDGHDYAIHRLLIDQDVATSTYTALIARVVTGCVVKNLGIESGEIRLTGTGSQASGAKYVGIFTSQGSGSSVFANCWSNADVNVDVEQYEIDCAPFGRNSATTKIINFIGNGDIDVKIDAGGGRGTARADATLDWSAGTTVNLANIGYTGTIHTEGGANNLSYVVGLATTSTYKGITKEQLHNIYGNGASGFSSKGDVNEWFPDAGFTADQVASGEIAWKLNDGYHDEYDSTYGHKYYTVKDGKLAFGAASEQAVRINVNSGDSTLYFYGFPGDTVALGDLFTMGNPTFAVAEAYAASIDADNVLTIKSLPNELEINVEVTFDGGLDYGKLAEAIASFDGKSDLDKYTSSLTATTLPAKLAEVQSKTYTSQAEIDKDVEILESYFYAKSIKDYAEYPSEEFYTVATLEELEYVAKYKGSLGVDQTVLFTANITVPADYTATVADVNDMDGLSASIDGNGYTLKGIRSSKASWLGTYVGRFISNITFEDCWNTVKMVTNYSSFLAHAVGEKVTFENISFVKCGVTCDDPAGDPPAGSKSNRRGNIFIGNLNKSADVTMKNITVTECEIVSRGSGNSGYLIGNISDPTCKVNIDGLYVYNNLYTGPVSSSGVGYLFGENNGTTTVKNAIITGNELSVDDETIQGVISGSTKRGVLTLENIIAYNNEGTDAMCGKTTDTKQTYTLVKKNIYSDTTVMTVYPEENRADNSAAIFSGEAANVINATDPAYTMAMKNGLPVFAEEGLPVKVTLDLLAGADVVLYTDIDGKLIGLTEDLTSRFWNGYDDLANTVFTEDTVVVQSDCNHDWVYTNNQNGTHTIECKTPNGCEEKKTVDCDLTYEQIDGVTHAVKCADCGYNTAENCTKETNHVYGTYGAESKHEAVCADCGHKSEATCSFTEKKVAHNNVAKGYTEYTCDCGYSYKVEEAEKAHEFSQNGVIVKAPSYTEEGTSKHACALCDAVEYRPVPALRGTGINVNAPISAMRGEEITVEIELANNAGNVAGMNLQVNYDAAVLSLVEAKDNGIFELAVLPDTAVAGKVNLTYANAGNVGADKTDGKALTTLTFKVLDAAVYGNTEITAEFVKSEDPADTGAVDYDSNFVEVGEGATVIAVMEYLWGDANMDGNVNVADAQVILQWKVGKDVAIDLTAADADRDGIVAIPDALMLLQYVNQLVEWDPNGTTTKPASLI